MKGLPFLILFFYPTVSLAQVDSSALTFVGGSSNQPPTTASGSSDSGMETNHYVKKHKSPPKKVRKLAQTPTAAKKSSEDSDTTDGDENQTPPPASDLQNAQVSPLPRLNGDTFNNDSAPEPVSSEEREYRASFGSKMRDMFWGGDVDVIDKYRSFLDSGDIRKNIFEVAVAPEYIYDSSLSPYFFRNYNSASPGAFIGVDIWLTPFLGIDADYRTTFLSALKDSPTQDSYASVSQSWFDMGLKFRRFFGMALNSSSLTVGIRYKEYSLLPPANSQSRMKLFIQGPELTMDASIPSGKDFSWLLGVSLAPYLNQMESATSSDMSSGQSNRTVGYGASVGGEYRMSRKTRLFFKASTQVIRTLFSGTSNAQDPVSGGYPSNVPVTDSIYIFDLGVTFGR